LWSTIGFLSLRSIVVVSNRGTISNSSWCAVGVNRGSTIGVNVGLGSIVVVDRRRSVAAGSRNHYRMVSVFSQLAFKSNLWSKN
jgi:hypothetical protein